MPRSHICPSCLTELARIRAVPDPHYRLPIVVCPRCKLACVRTKHPDQAFWRETRRAMRSVRLLVLTVVMTVLSAGTIAGMSFSMRLVLTNRRGDLRGLGSIDPDETYYLLGAALLVMLGGCVVRMIYAHQKFWVAWLILMIPSTIFVYLDAMVGWAIDSMRRMLDLNPSLEIPSTAELAGRSKVFFIMIGVASAGMLLGILMNRMVLTSSRKRVSKIRRKIRIRQAKQY